MKIITNTNVKASTITPLSEQFEYKWATALTDNRLCVIGRTVGVSSEYIVFDFGSAKSCDYCIILGHNFSATASVTLQANTSNTWASPAFSQTLDHTQEKMCDVFSAAQSYRYWRLLMTDSSNTDGYIELSKVFIDSALTMPEMALDQTIPYQSTSDAAFSYSGQVYGNPGYYYQAATINFPAILDTEKKLIEAYYNTVDIYTPFILLVWEDDLDIQPPIFCVLTTPLEWKRASGNSGLEWTLTLSFREVK